MSDDLKADLQEIKGVGEATAEAIMDVLYENDIPTDDPDAEAWVLTGYWAKALEAAEAGNDRQAAVYLRRAHND